MPTEYTENLPVEVSVYRSPRDGSVVVQIDQEESGSGDNRIRVTLNDGPIFDGDTEVVSALDPQEAREVATQLHFRYEARDVDPAGLAKEAARAIDFLNGRG